MLDNVAKVNIISHLIVLKYGLQKVDILLLTIEGFRGEKGYYYGAYKLRMRIADSTR
jgi:hypothetical protein